MKPGTCLAASLVAFVELVQAQSADFNPVSRPSKGEKVVAATDFTIRWTAPEKYENVTIKIDLIGGESQGTQVPLLEIASGIQNADEQYDWSVPYTKDVIGRSVYGLKLTSEENEQDWQYSNPFMLVVDDHVIKNKSITPISTGHDENGKSGGSPDSSGFKQQDNAAPGGHASLVGVASGGLLTAFSIMGLLL